MSGSCFLVNNSYVIFKIMQGELEVGEHTKQQVNNEKPPKHFLEKLTAKAVESSRENVDYLHQSIRKPVVAVLKGLRGY